MSVCTGRHTRLVAEAIACEEELARDADAIGYMSRILVQTTLPHKSKVGQLQFDRTNGIYRLSIVSPNGLPAGGLPRLLLAWVTTEATRTKSPDLSLGRSANQFMIRLGLREDGKDAARVREQAFRLFTSLVTLHRIQGGVNRSFDVENLLIVRRGAVFWNPKTPNQEALWDSNLVLTADFFKEVLASPVPIDMRAYRALRASPLAMDIYAWLIYRHFVLRRSRKQFVVIPWESLQHQFGADYDESAKGCKNFSQNFKVRLKEALLFYPEAKVEAVPSGLLLRASRLKISHSRGADIGAAPCE